MVFSSLRSFSIWWLGWVISNRLCKSEGGSKDDITSLLESWRLTPSQRTEIFSSLVLPTQLAPFLSSTTSTTSSSHHPPLAIIILGQTGAGKTSLAPLLLPHFSSSSPPLHFIADTYKTFHPKFHSCPPRYASQLASADARYWLKLACVTAAQHRKDVLVESACRHPDDFVSLVQIFKGVGYIVKVVVLAVNEGVSRLGCLVRFYKKLPEAGGKWGLGVRKTPKKVHDESCEGAKDGVRFVEGEGEGEGNVDGVVVVRRGGMVAYEGRGGKGGIGEVLERERRRGLSREEWKGVEEGLELLKAVGEEEREEVERVVRGLGIVEDMEGLREWDVEGFVRGRGLVSLM
ncbi:zeta toxin-domain-containing protein [Podospora fimiseda]|uniref:Zeta toxin-domain-containing protein n=1 Tax=Podospora fimiseda TaxID=252190 RepID=A0AAN7BCZ7_9PEZI|nr:zeta toxin-domain-containing protein [Podospora fimiseda]